MDRVYNAISELEKDRPQGVMAHEINDYLGENPCEIALFAKELRFLVEKGFIVECDTKRKPLSQKHFRTAQSFANFE